MQYQTIRNRVLRDLDNEVNAMLNKGWILHGYQYADPDGDYIQPMIKP